jgi:hypothetical protein
VTCGQFSLLGSDGKEAGVYFLRCKSWRCRRCGPRKVRRMIAIIRAGMAAGHIRFMTLTAPGDEDVGTSFRQATRRWKRLHLRIERRWGKFEYFIVVEPQQRGHAHLHVLIRGPRYLPQRQLGAMAQEVGFGRIVDIRAAHRQLPGYLAKYLTKTLGLTPAQSGRYFRRVRMSRHWVDALAWDGKRKWDRWWILDAPPIAAALEARRRGLRVVHFDTDGLEPPTMLGRIVQWLHSLRGYRSAGFWHPPQVARLHAPIAAGSGRLGPPTDVAGLQPPAATGLI